MSRKKLNIFQKINIILKYIKNDPFKNYAGIDCEFCKGMEFEKISEKRQEIASTIVWTAEYKCKKCGAIIEETQIQSKI